MPQPNKRLNGVGQLLIGSQVVARVRYGIDLYQEWIDVSDHAGWSSVPGATSAEGALDVLDGSKRLEPGLSYTLVLDDMRRCTVTVASAVGPGQRCDLMLLEFAQLH